MTDVVLTAQLQGGEQIMAGLQQAAMKGQQISQSLGMNTQQQAKFMKEFMKGAVQGMEAELNKFNNTVNKSTEEAAKRTAGFGRALRETNQALTATVAVAALFTRNNEELSNKLEAVTLALLGITTALRAVRAIAQAVIAVFGAKVAAVLALIAAGVALIMNWDAVAKAAKKVWDFLSGYLARIWNGMKKMLEGLGQFILGVFQIDVSKLIPSWQALSDFFSKLWDAWAVHAEGVSRIIKGAFTFDSEEIKAGWAQFKDGAAQVLDAFKPVGEAIRASLDNENTRGGIEKMAEGFGDIKAAAAELGIEIAKLTKAGIDWLAQWIKGTKELDEWFRSVRDRFAEVRKEIITEAQAESMVFFESVGQLSGQQAVEVMRASLEAAEAYSKQIETIRQARIVGLIKSDEEEKALMEQAEQAHQDRLNKIEEDALKKKYGISQVYRKLDLNSAQGFFGQMSQLMTSKHKAMFKIGKAAAISETVIDTYKAAQGAYASLASIPIVGPALGIAAAAAAIASGMARVQAIRAQQFGEGGGVSAGSSGGAVAVGGGGGMAGFASAGGQVPTDDQRPEPNMIQVIIQGNLIGNREFVTQTLIPTLQEEINNRSVVIIGQNSRQAQELATQ